jgi:hypothetical protein
MSARKGTQTLHSISVRDCKAVDLRMEGWMEELLRLELKLQQEMLMWRSVGCRNMIAVLPKVNFLLSDGWPWSVTLCHICIRFGRGSKRAGETYRK